MNCAFSFGVFAGNESRNLSELIRILLKNSLCWNSFAVIRCAGRRVIRRGSTCCDSSLGSGLEHKKLLPVFGTVDEDEKSRL